MPDEDAKSANLTACKKENQWVQYFADAEPNMEREWNNIIWEVIKGFDFTTTLEIAPGGGRNSARLIPLAKEIHLVDVNQYCIDICRERFDYYEGPTKINYHLNDGSSLEMIAADSVTALYTWDSAVHMDKTVIREYFKEFARVMKPGAKAFVHHSNYGTISDSTEFKNNPHWRTNMSAALALDYAAECGLSVPFQKIIPWGGDVEDLDCLTVLEKPAG